MWKSSSWVFTGLWVNWKTFFTTKAVKYWNRLPERLCSLHLWKFLRPKWISPEYLHQPQSWQLFEEEAGLQTSQGPFHPESSCGPVNWRFYWGQLSVHSGSAVFCELNSSKDFDLPKSGAKEDWGEVDFSFVSNDIFCLMEWTSGLGHNSRRVHAIWILYTGFSLNVSLGMTAGTIKNISASLALLPPLNMNLCFYFHRIGTQYKPQDLRWNLLMLPLISTMSGNGTSVK